MTLAELKEIAKKAGIEFKDIEFDIDQEAAVRRLAKHLNEYDVLPDDELMVEDGETSEEDVNTAFEEYLETTNEDDYVMDDEEESEAKESLMQDLNDMLGEFDLGSIDEISNNR